MILKASSKAVQGKLETYCLDLLEIYVDYKEKISFGITKEKNGLDFSIYNRNLRIL